MAGVPRKIQFFGDRSCKGININCVRIVSKVTMNHPFTCMIIGPIKAGKTEFVKKLIENKDFMINQLIFKTMWFYTEDQPL